MATKRGHGGKGEAREAAGSMPGDCRKKGTVATAIEALADSEARYRRLVEGCPDIVYVYSNRSGGIYWSERVREILGLSPEDVTHDSQKWHDAIHPEDLPTVDAAIRQALDGKPFAVEYRIQDQSGGWHWFLDRSIGSRIEGDEVIIEGLATDITDRKKTEVAIRESEEKLRAIADYTVDWESWLSSDGQLLWVNPAVEQYAGYTPHECHAMRDYPLPLVVKEDQGSVREHLESAQNGHSGENLEFRYLNKNGTEFWGAMSWRPVMGPRGESLGFRTSVRDITRRKHAEKLNWAREAKLRSIFRSAPVGIGMVINRVIREANDHLSQMTGYSLNELIGMDVRQLYLTQGDYESVGREKYRQIAALGTGCVETRWKQKGGGVIQILLSSTALDPADLSKGVTFSALDITERKRSAAILESRLRLSECAAVSSLEVLLQKALDEAELLTESQIAFFHFVDADQRTLHLQTWSSNTIRNMCAAEGKGQHYDLDRAGVWADSVRQRRAVIHNDYATVEHRKGLPPGHAPVRREAVVPVMRDERIVALLGVGNKTYDYDEADVMAITLLADLTWDIVERRRVEEALRQRDEEFRILFENSADGILVVNSQDLTIHATNHAMTKMIGASPTSLAGRSIWSMHPPEALDRVRQEFEEHLRGERSESSEIPVLRTDGATIYADMHSFNIRIAGIHHLAATFRDVTQRRKLMHALRESESRYRTIFNASPQIILLIRNASYVYGNPAALAALHINSLMELSRTKVVEVVHPGHRAAITARIQNAFQGLTNPPLEIPMIAKDGSIWYLEAISTSIMLEDGPAVLVMGTDVTARRKAEERAKESALFLRQTQAIARIGGWKANPETNYLYWTDEVREILEISAEVQLSYEESLEFLLPEYVTELRNSILETFHTGQSFTMECRIRTSTGKVLWTVARGLAQVADDRSVYVMGTIQDISERKKEEEERLELERHLLHAQKLESLGVLAGGIAHDFNNLLMAILGNLDIALEDLSPVSSARYNIEQAVQAGRRAADLTRQMLAYSGKGQAIVRVLDVNDLVTENAHMLRAAIAKNVNLNLSLGERRLLVRGDAGQLQQVIMNLITNGSEAIGEKDGIVRLSTGVMSCNENYLAASRLDNVPAPGQYVWFEVSDTGCGMNEEVRQRLFDPFFTTKFTGRGLGMSAVLGIVKGHKGAILVESESDQGTAIRVLFPAVDNAGSPLAPDAHEKPPETAVATESGMVLVVEDEEMVRDLSASMLTRCGYVPITACDGEEALRIFSAHADEIKCIILDLSMPVMDGVATFGRIRQINTDVPVILCSGFDEQEATRRFAESGLSGFLQKPFRQETIAMLLRRVLDKA